MTGAENERLAKVETQIADIQADVSEIKTDVKALSVTILQARLADAEREGARSARDQARGNTGVWVRALLPWVVAVASLALGVYNIVAQS